MTTAVRAQDMHGDASGVPRETGFARFAPWMARIVLAMASVVFTVIGLRYLVDPAGASASTGVTLNTPLGYSVTRVGFGGFPLALAIFSFMCLISRRRLYEGARLIATLAATVIVVRLYGTMIDGFEKESVVLFVPELVLLALAGTASLLDPARRRRQAEPGIRP